jgi:LysR family glycine cleavage system transcriptional activator
MNLPDIETLRCFVEAAKTLNFRQASRVVGLTPAALGQRIKQLENQLDVPLFLRTTRKVELTEAGLAMLPRAIATLQAAMACTQSARGELGPAPMILTIGTRHELGLSWIQPMLGALEARFSHIDCHLYFGSGEDLNRRVLAGEIDCAISSKRMVDPGLDFVNLHREDYVFVGRAELLNEKPVDDADSLGVHTLVDVGPELPLFYYTRQSSTPVDPRSFGAFKWMGTIAAIRSKVLAGDGLAVLPLYLVRADLEKGDMRIIWPDRTLDHDWFRLLFRDNDPRVAFFRTLGDAMQAHPLQ